MNEVMKPWNERIDENREDPDPSQSPSAVAAIWMVVRVLLLSLAAISIQAAVIVMPRRIAKLRAEGGDEAAEVAKVLRLTEVWGILMLGSALVLAAVCIQLALL